MQKPSALERELQVLAGQLKKVETEYTMYFSGRTNRPPVESRAALDRAFKRFDRMTFDGPISRFRFTTLQARYSSFADLWDRGVRAREEGRGGPFARPTGATPAPVADGDELLHATVFADPMQEMDKVRDLYDALMQARREGGRAAVPFHRFAGLVREQVKTLQEKNPGDQVRFLVTRHDGQVNLTARAVKASADDDADA